MRIYKDATTIEELKELSDQVLRLSLKCSPSIYKLLEGAKKSISAGKINEAVKIYKQVAKTNLVVKLSEAGSKKSLTLPWIHGERGPFRQWAINMHKGDVTSTYAEYLKLDFDKYLKKSLEDLVNELK